MHIFLQQLRLVAKWLLLKTLLHMAKEEKLHNLFDYYSVLFIDI